MTETARGARWKSEAAEARSLARLAAVQALYQMDLAQTDVSDVIAQFLRHRLAPSLENTASEGDAATISLHGADKQFFADLVRGVVRRQLEIDPMLDGQLAKGWRLFRIDSTLRAIMRAGTFELLERIDVPARAVISEYVDVAHAFFEGEESKVANGILDKIARRLRPAEFPKAEGAADE